MSSLRLTCVFLQWLLFAAHYLLEKVHGDEDAADTGIKSMTQEECRAVMRSRIAMRKVREDRSEQGGIISAEAGALWGFVLGHPTAPHSEARVDGQAFSVRTTRRSRTAIAKYLFLEARCVVHFTIKH